MQKVLRSCIRFSGRIFMADFVQHLHTEGSTFQSLCRILYHGVIVQDVYHRAYRCIYIHVCLRHIYMYTCTHVYVYVDVHAPFQALFLLDGSSLGRAASQQSDLTVTWSLGCRRTPLRIIPPTPSPCSSVRASEDHSQSRVGYSCRSPSNERKMPLC